MNVQALPDKGERLLKQVEELETALSSLNLETEENAKEGKIIVSNVGGTGWHPSKLHHGLNTAPTCIHGRVLDLRRAPPETAYGIFPFVQLFCSLPLPPPTVAAPGVLKSLPALKGI